MEDASRQGAGDGAERAAWLRLALTPAVGARTARALLAAFGLPQQIFAAPVDALAAVAGQAIAQCLVAPASDDIAKALRATEDWLAADARRGLVTFADADYPYMLLEGIDPPPLLFAEGRRELLAHPALAIVGSRNCTQQGAANAEMFAEHLGHAGLTTVSGLALGIDAAAHRGGLRAPASTIAVTGTGLDLIYPTRNRALAAAIREQGVLLSELPLGTPALRANFPRRNRLIASLARGVLVVEAALHSGSLITARLAATAGREVFALPGSIHAPLARGCHRLIGEGARLVESAADVLEELRMAVRPAARTASVGTPHASLLTQMGHDPVDFDVLAVRAGGPVEALSAALLELELTQHIERLPGNRYQRLR
jgi:DNA processing protein